MLRRDKTATTESTTSTTSSSASGEGVRPGGKGRPTPTRKEAEAEARRRARAALDSKSSRKAQRAQRAEQSRTMRAGMKAGDERYLMKRDQGPVKRAVRTFVDSRISLAEFLLPLLLVALVLQASNNAALVSFGATLVTTTTLVALLDTVWLNYRLKRALRTQFPDESLKGVTLYAVMRVIQMRPLRMPKPQVKIGGAPK